MTAYATLHERCSRRTMVGVALLIGLLAAPLAAEADDLPVFKQGMWVFNRTISGKSMEMRRCVDPNENVLQKPGCKISPIKKSGTRYTFTADCPEGNPQSPILGGHTDVVLEVKGDSFYQVVSEGVVAGQTVKEYLDARRSGDCDQKSGK
jgi:hypothetical protein